MFYIQGGPTPWIRLLENLVQLVELYAISLKPCLPIITQNSGKIHVELLRKCQHTERTRFCNTFLGQVLIPTCTHSVYVLCFCPCSILCLYSQTKSCMNSTSQIFISSLRVGLNEKLKIIKKYEKLIYCKILNFHRISGVKSNAESFFVIERSVYSSHRFTH